jgi:hypothetical protein
VGFVRRQSTGGHVGYSKLKTRHVAQVSVQQFLWVHPVTYYWTFTVHEILEDKVEALRRAKPLFDLIARRTGLSERAGQVTRERGTYLAFWELQKRGSWHLHLLTDVFLDVNWLRPWMVERGWGQQMRVEQVKVNHSHSYTRDYAAGGLGVANVGNGGRRLANYLTKYLTKSLDELPRKKAFCGSAAAKVGTIGFQWTPETNPYAYFFFYGRQLFFELHGRQPNFREFRYVCRLGYEAVEWFDRDPWTDPPG